MSVPRIARLEVEGVGPFRKLAIEFPKIESESADAKKAEIHLLVGPNGSGKSTLLYALAAAFDWPGRAQAPIRSRLHEHSRISIELMGQRYTLTNGLPQLHPSHVKSSRFGDPNRIIDDYVRLSGGQDQGVSIPFFVCAYSGARDLAGSQIDAIRELSSPALRGTLDFVLSEPQSLAQWIASERFQALLAKEAGQSDEAQRHEAALDRVEGLVEEICGYAVKFVVQRQPLAVKLRIGGEALDFAALPDGVRSMLAWVIDLTMRMERLRWIDESSTVFDRPVILLLDEIDVHLHPKWQRRILPAVQKWLPNAQIFASTHSPFVVGSVSDACVYVLPESPATQSDLAVSAQHLSTGASYRVVYANYFGLDSEFDIETEGMLNRFYAALQGINQGDLTRRTELEQCAEQLRSLSTELSSIVDRELRQLRRLKGVSLA